jgi:HSP20 family protein
MKEQGLATQPAREITPNKTETSNLAERVHELFDLVSRRAYDIFETNGRALGRDLADWFQAEGEFLHPVRLDLSESEHAFTVSAEVPGFTEKELEITVEPRRLTISGKHEIKDETKTKKMVRTERRANQILRVVDLPGEVDTEKTKATLKNGVLELEIPKAAPAKKVQIQAKAA